MAYRYSTSPLGMGISSLLAVNICQFFENFSVAKPHSRFKLIDLIDSRTVNELKVRGSERSFF